MHTYFRKILPTTMKTVEVWVMVLDGADTHGIRCQKSVDR